MYIYACNAQTVSRASYQKGWHTLEREEKNQTGADWWHHECYFYPIWVWFQSKNTRLVKWLIPSGNWAELQDRTPPPCGRPPNAPDTQQETNLLPTFVLLVSESVSCFTESPLAMHAQAKAGWFRSRGAWNGGGRRLGRVERQRVRCHTKDAVHRQGYVLCKHSRGWDLQ